MCSFFDTKSWFQDNYTFAQPGIQNKVKALEELVSRMDGQSSVQVLPVWTDVFQLMESAVSCVCCCCSSSMCVLCGLQRTFTVT